MSSRWRFSVDFTEILEKSHSCRMVSLNLRCKPTWNSAFTSSQAEVADFELLTSACPLFFDFGLNCSLSLQRTRWWSVWHSTLGIILVYAVHFSYLTVAPSHSEEGANASTKDASRLFCGCFFAARWGYWRYRSLIDWLIVGEGELVLCAELQQ